MMDFTNLNEKQLEAVNYIDGPLLVLAGAGSGKTKVLTTRICNLVLNHSVEPNNILAITFTNKAAKEMKDRVFKELGIPSYRIQISTFHALGVTIIKEHYDLLGYEKNFTILDSDDTLTLIKKILKDLDYDPKQYNPKAIRNMIRDHKIPQIDGILYASNKPDMISTDMSLLNLYKEGKITKETALNYATNEEMLKKKL